MKELTSLDSQVEALVAQVQGHGAVPVHAAHDYPVHAGTAAVWLRAQDLPLPIVTVTAYVASGVPATPALLAELNSATAHSPLTQLVWAGGSVVSHAAVPASAADALTVSVLCQAVADEATRLGPLLATMFGGATAFPSTLALAG